MSKINRLQIIALIMGLSIFWGTTLLKFLRISLFQKQYYVVYQISFDELKLTKTGSLDYSYGISILNIFSNPLKDNGIEEMRRVICLRYNYDEKKLIILNIIKKGTVIKKKRRGEAVDKKNDIS